MKLLTTNNTKTLKDKRLGYLVGILHLAPARLSGRNTCPYSSPGCRAACLNTAGMGVFSNVQEARIRKTRLLFENAPVFLHLLIKDIKALVRQAEKQGLKPAVRLNGTSDIRWEKVFPVIFKMFSGAQFYDYTKYPYHIRPKEGLPPNYHLTFSESERKESARWAKNSLEQGRGVAVCTAKNVQNTVNGDESDLRFKDKPSAVILLRPKGKAKKDNSGFVKTSISHLILTK